MATKPDILVIIPIRPAQMQMLQDSYTLHRYDQAEDRDAFLTEVGDKIRGVVTMGISPFTEDMLDHLPRLEIVALGSVGYDTIDVEACNARGIPVTNTPDVLTNDVADLAMALTFDSFRGYSRGERYVRQGRWRDEGSMAPTTSVTGKTMGIVGLGRIGKAIARRAEAFEMKVAYHGRREQSEMPYAFFDTPAALAAESDVVVLACPGGDETRGLVNREVLDGLGADGHLVNISRGSVVNEPELLKALQNNRIAGAALDVFDNEPKINEAFFTLDNVVLQPHVGSATQETRGAMAQLVVDNLAAHFSGKPLLTPV
ncbi:MAG: 2-hydroxyacid dehydrogenase [Hyphomicrobiaceae bacterium]|nr:2-hydroxyacid dehydrogenase [Hyphomicrobiaceae bacterium]